MTSVSSILYQDDLADDVRNFYIQRIINDEYSGQEAEYVKNAFGPEIQDADDAPVFWIALANVQWEYGRLEDCSKETALSFIEDGLSSEELQDWIFRIGGKSLLTELVNKLRSPQPQKKCDKKIKKYVCPWKNGDVFAYQMCGKEAKDNGFDMSYVFLVKVSDTEMSNGNIVPIVYMYHTISDRILSISELEKVAFIPQFWRPEVYDRNPGRKPLVRLELDATSQRSVPKKQLTYIGNIDVSPVDGEDLNSRGVYWNFFEHEVIQNFSKWEGHSIREIIH